MSGETLFALVIVVVVIFGIAIVQLGKHQQRIRRLVLDRLDALSRILRRREDEPDGSVVGSRSKAVSDEEESRAELKRLQRLIEDRKQVARETDISYHLWGLYRDHFLGDGQHSTDRFSRNGEWYDVTIHRAGENNGLNEFEFELKGDRYRFVDDEEAQGWCETIKLFSLYLYDGSGRCLIEIPMKVRVDKRGRAYSIVSDGPKAFLPGDWINDFINVKLKNQSIRNREIRAQKHKERLSEIEDLRDRFGIWE